MRAMRFELFFQNPTFLSTSRIANSDGDFVVDSKRSVLRGGSHLLQPSRFVIPDIRIELQFRVHQLSRYRNASRMVRFQIVSGDLVTPGEYFVFRIGVEKIDIPEIVGFQVFERTQRHVGIRFQIDRIGLVGRISAI